MKNTIRNLMVSASLATVVTIFGSVSLLAKPVVNADRHGIALHGFDTVAYAMDRHPAKGRKSFTAEWRGATFHFESDFNRLAFLSDPQYYLPAFEGYCAYSAALGKKRDVDPAVWVEHKGRIYLFSNSHVRKIWLQDRDKYIAQGEARWEAL